MRYSVPYSYRGFKALTAQQRGAAGILIYSDPADDGEAKGKVYPHGPWGPASHIQRGGVVYDFMVPGDPLTPGWASMPGRTSNRPERAESLPRIISAPLSHRDARPILEALAGPVAPKTWQGGLPIRYRIGPGPAKVRLRVRSDDACAADLDGDRNDPRQRAAGSDGHRRQPSRRVDLRRRRSVERIGGARWSWRARSAR